MLHEDELDFAKIYIGSHMERATWLGKIVNFKHVNSQFGPSVVYNFVTRTGKYGCFFIKEEIPELQENVCFHFEGTVKAHRYNSYGEQYETHFNRVKIKKILGKLVDSDDEI